MVTLIIGMMFLLFTGMHFWVWGILQRWSACAPTAYEVVRFSKEFEKHWSRHTVKRNLKEIQSGQLVRGPKFDLGAHGYKTGVLKTP
jgi:hypothetical protein